MAFNHLSQPLRQPLQGLHIKPTKVRLAPNIVPCLNRGDLALFTYIRREVEQAIEDIGRGFPVGGGDRFLWLETR